jgi:DMSO/TMAO reductase YedYZ molybdopterin-dependent catalytic subunit
VPLVDILSRCEPLPGAKYVVFHSFQYDQDGFEYYEVLDIRLGKHPHTILAYEMNGKMLEIPHGAPLRLRVETQLGYKMVKWLNSIELVSDYRSIGRGQGGYREDVMFYGIGAGI